MLHLHRKFLGFACAGLLGCALGAAGDDDEPTGEFAPDTTRAEAAIASALVSDAAAPLIQAPTNVVSPSTAASPSPAAVALDGGTQASLPPSLSSSVDAAVSSTSRDASTTGNDAAAAVVDASTPSRDAGTKPVVSAPMCSPLTCNNNCLLLPRCCNDNNECACLAPFGTCSLPSL